jgi:hypothetical protein
LVVVILKEQWKVNGGSEATAALTAHVLAKCLELRTNDSAHVLSCILDIKVREGSADSLKEACDLCDELAQKVDVIRVKFWDWKKEQVEALKAALV